MNELKPILEMITKIIGILLFIKISYYYNRYEKQPSRFEVMLTIISLL